jgi:hypothetical protein
MRSTVSLAVVAVALMLAPAAAKSPAPKSHHPVLRLADRWTIGGEGGWDYLYADPDARRLYVSHATRMKCRISTMGRSSAGSSPARAAVLQSRAVWAWLRLVRPQSSVMVFSLDSLKEIARVPVQVTIRRVLYERFGACSRSTGPRT